MSFFTLPFCEGVLKSTFYKYSFGRAGWRGVTLLIMLTILDDPSINRSQNAGQLGYNTTANKQVLCHSYFSRRVLITHRGGFD